MLMIGTGREHERNEKERESLTYHTIGDLDHSDEGLTIETSVFESFTVANLPYRPFI